MLIPQGRPKAPKASGGGATPHRGWLRSVIFTASVLGLIALFSPSWASEITSLTPLRPRRARLRRNSVQKVSASEAPIAMPSTSRRPSPLTPTAMMTATETIRPA
jgi:hypothetical protein